jgi:transcriptional regulator with XRE-family HTH domain
MVTAGRLRQGHRSLAAFAATTGLSRTTLDSIEHGRKTSYDPGTLATLEGALGWRTGSVERVLAGLEPQLVEDPDLAAITNAWPRLSSGSRRMLAILATEAARTREG